MCIHKNYAPENTLQNKRDLTVLNSTVLRKNIKNKNTQQ